MTDARTARPDGWEGAATTRLARYLLLGTVFVPLVLYLGVYFPYVTSRALLFRLLVEGAVLVLLWQLLVRDVEVRDGRDPLLWALLAWVAAGLLSALLSPATHHSLFGSMERMWGWTQWLHLGLFYLLVRVYFDEAWWEKFFKATLLVSVAVGLYAAGQYAAAHYQEALIGAPLVEPPPGRFASTLGNPGYLAVYALIHLPVAAGVFRRSGGGWKTVALLAAAVNAVALALAGTRSVMVGVAGGAVVAAILWLWVAYRPEGRPLPWRSLALGAGGGGLLALGLWASGLLPPLAEWPGLGRLASLGEGLEVIRRRRIAWEAAWQGFTERPLTGWGLETFHMVFDRFADPELYRTGGTVNWDRAHNVFFGALAGTGVVGTVAYGAVWAAVGALTWRCWRDRPCARPVAALLTVLVVGYGTYLFFWFEDQNSTFLLLALLGWTRYRETEAPVVRIGAYQPTTVPRRTRLRKAVLGAVVLVAAGLCWRASSTARAARHIVRGVAASSLERAVTSFETARGLATPQSRDVATEYASFVGRWGRSASGPLRRGEGQDLFSRAVGGAEQALNRELARAPTDERLLAHRADLALGAYAGTGAPEAYELMTESLGGALRLTPNRLHYYERLASYQQAAGRTEEAMETIARGLSRYGAYGGLYRTRARIHRVAGRADSAVRDLKRSLWLGDTEDGEFVRTVARAEADAGRPDRAASLLAGYVAARYLPPLWGEIGGTERRPLLEEQGVSPEPGPYRRYRIRPVHLPLLVRWHRYARAAGDPGQAKLAAKVALNGLSEAYRTDGLAAAIAPLAGPLAAEGEDSQ